MYSSIEACDSSTHLAQRAPRAAFTSGPTAKSGASSQPDRKRSRRFMRRLSAATTWVMGPSRVGLTLGTQVPALPRYALGEGPRVLADLIRAKTLVLFWNPGCGYCRSMRDALRRWERRRSKAAPRLVIISAGDEASVRAEGFESPRPSRSRLLPGPRVRHRRHTDGRTRGCRSARGIVCGCRGDSRSCARGQRRVGGCWVRVPSLLLSQRLGVSENGPGVAQGCLLCAAVS